jgi:hypothetical protein
MATATGDSARLVRGKRDYLNATINETPEVLKKGIFRHIALVIHNSPLERRGLSAVHLHKYMGPMRI